MSAKPSAREWISVHFPVPKRGVETRPVIRKRVKTTMPKVRMATEARRTVRPFNRARGQKYDKQHDAARRLAKQSSESQAGSDPFDGDAQNPLRKPAKRQTAGDERGGSHPDAQLVSVFEQADRAIAYVALCADQPIRLISIQEGIQLGSGAYFDKTDGHIADSRDYPGFGGEE